MPFPTGSFFNRSSGGGSDSSNPSSNESRGYPRGSRGNGSEGPRRGNIVVSSVEISRLFDSVKSLGEELRKQNQSIKILAGNVKECTTEIAALKQELADLRNANQDHVPGVRNGIPSFTGPIPKALKDDVHLAHNQQNEMQFRGKEGIESSHNTAVRAFLVQELTKEENGYEKPAIMRAVTRYFETKRQQYLDNLPERKEATAKKLKEKILTSRRRRLYVQRIKVASEEEKERLLEIDHNYMSDEEDGDEEGIWVVRSPSWRSAELSSLLGALQKRLKEKESSSKHPKNKRIRGANSTREAPSKPPRWAIAQQQQRQTPAGQPTSSRQYLVEPATRRRNAPTRHHEGRTSLRDLEDEGSSRSSPPRSPTLPGKRAHDFEERQTWFSDEESDEGLEPVGEFSDDEFSDDAEPANEQRICKKKKLSFSQVQQELALSPADPKTTEQMPAALKSSTPINGGEYVANNNRRKPGRRLKRGKAKKQ